MNQRPRRRPPTPSLNAKPGCLKVVDTLRGTHDAAFLAALLRRNGITDTPDLPFFWEDDRGLHQFPDNDYGAGATTDMLATLADEISADPVTANGVHGIVLVRDSGDAPAKVFDAFGRELARLGLLAPRRPGEWSEPSSLGPRVALLLIPAHDRPGGLETLCLDYLRERHPDVSRCVEQFFQCVPAFDRQRTAERQHKAEIACAIAALHRESPTRSLAYGFFGSAPLIDVTAACFQATVATLRSLFRTAGEADGSAI
jgi:hypothetical protein